MNSSRVIGLILISIGFGIAVIAGLYIAVQTSAAELTGGGAVLGAGLFFIPVALLVGGGIYLLARSGAEAKEQSTMQQQRQLLDMVRARGQVTLDQVALEIGAPIDAIRDLVYQLVGLQVFSGYINWDEGKLYSVEASKLRELKQCENCGGEIELVGKGVVRCRFCGTEYFLS